VDDDDRVAALKLHPPEHLQTVHAGHPLVDQGGVDASAVAEQRDACFTVRSFLDLVAGGFECEAHHPSQMFLVVDDKNSHRGPFRR